MTDTDHSSARRTALATALAALPLPTSDLPVALLPISAAQWRRSVSDADLDARVTEYGRCRLRVSSTTKCDGAALGRHLRPAALGLARAACDICEHLEILAALDPDKDLAPNTACDWRKLVAQDAHSVLVAAVDDAESPQAPTWPTRPDIPDDGERDVLLTIFGIPTEDLTDDAGSFCDSRVIAFYRLRLLELQKACDPILNLVGDRPPSIFTAVSAVRDLVTSASPSVTLWGARDIRTRILAAFNADPTRTCAALAEAAQDGRQGVGSLRPPARLLAPRGSCPGQCCRDRA
jgi:hypothetical protein